MKIFLILFLILVLRGMGLWGEIPKFPIKSFTLKNGMEFHVLERPGTRTFAGITLVKTGSAVEEKASYGLAHLMEHMSFKTVPQLKGIQPESVKGNIIAHLYARNGGKGLNAVTEPDFTQFQVKLPAAPETLELWFQVESERIKKLNLREFEQEKEVIMEEWRQVLENNPDGFLANKFLEAGFPGHPYGHTVIGIPGNIRNFSEEDVQNFFKTYYVPNNIAAIIVGNINIEEVKTLAKNYFGNIPSGKPIPVFQVNEPVQGRENRIEARFDADVRLLIGYRVPAFPHKEHMVMTLILELLGGSSSARLDRILVREKQMVSRLFCSLNFPCEKYPAMFLIDLVPDAPYKPGDVEKIIYEQIEKIKKEPISQQELQKILNQYESTQYKYLQDNMQIAESMTRGIAAFGDPNVLLKKLEKNRDISASDILNTARKIFRVSNRTVAVLLSTKETGGVN